MVAGRGRWSVPRARAEAAHRRAFVGVARAHEERLGIEIVVVDRIGHGRRENLADHTSGFALGELQNLIGAHDVETANEVEDHASLRRRHTRTAHARARAGALAANEVALVQLGTSHYFLPFTFFS